MATTPDPARLALFEPRPTSGPSGAWWPRSRLLAVELAELFEHWPRAEGTISRLLYSPPDWDDRPRTVGVPGRRVKTGSFPRDDTRLLSLTLHDHTRRTLVVVPPSTPRDEAVALLRG